MMNNRYISFFCHRIVLLSGLISLSPFANAAGTAASTVINNTATVNYTVGVVSGTVSASNTIVVQEILDVNVVWQDASNVAVFSPSPDRILTFLLTNTGNGNEQFLLSVNDTLSGDDFDPVSGSPEIWIDDGDGVYIAATDTLYNGSNGPVLNGADPANDRVAIFVVADIPSGLAATAFSNIGLTATSVTADATGQTGNIGAEIIGAGDGGVNANVGLSGATSSAIGAYQVLQTNVAIGKSVQVIDALGGTVPHPSAVLRYQLQVSVNGASPVSNLVITDPLQAEMIFIPGSIRLNGVVQTDAADAPVDFSDFNFSATNTVTVDLSQGGAVTIAPPVIFTIVFDVEID